MPHSPPQNAAERLCGTPKGGTGVMRQGANGMAPAAWKIAIRPLWKVSTARKPATKPTTRRVGVIGGSRSACAPDQPGVPRLLSPFHQPCQTTGEAWWPRRSGHARVALEEGDGPLPGELGGLGRVALLAGVVVEGVVRAVVDVQLVLDPGSVERPAERRDAGVNVLVEPGVV